MTKQWIYGMNPEAFAARLKKRVFARLNVWNVIIRQIAAGDGRFYDYEKSCRTAFEINV